ncbi:protein phosphatase 1F isoform X1, partial [Tachysurus ichikawai]
MGTKDQDGAQSFLKSFVEEFVNPLGHDDPLPLAPLSRTVTLEEVKGESLDLGHRLLTA